MALDRYISSIRKIVAKSFDLKTDAEIDAFFLGMEVSAKDNQEALEKRDKMLRDTVEELCKAKRLLKAAVEDFANIYDHIFGCDGMCDTCPIHGERDNCLVWQYADEALKLIGEEVVETENETDENDADAMDVISNFPATDVQPANQWISVKDRLPEAPQD